MSAWSGRHFRSPYLAATVGLGAGAGEIELRHGSRIGSVEIAGDLGAAMALFAGLADPASAVWRDVSQNGGAHLQSLVGDLDRLGWLRDADESGRDRRDEHAARLDNTLVQARIWLDAPGGTGAVRSDNLAAALLGNCRGRLRRSSPLADRILREVLDGDHLGDREWDSIALAVCDPAEVTQQVWGGLQLAVMSGCDDLAARHEVFVPASVPDGPGLNLLVEAEHCAEALLDALGESELLQAIDQPGGLARAAPTVFLHRWFETVRYVDAAAGLLSYRLRPELRAIVLEYLREEMGHEVHEVQTCRALGLEDGDLAQFAPLAWFAAYPEMLAIFAQRRPLSFLLSMTVAEGLPGSGRQLTQRLLDRGLEAASAADHDEIDRELNHQMVTRTMLAQLPWVDGEAGRAAIADFLQIVEVAHRAWQLLSRSVESGLPATPRPFEMSAETLLELSAAR